jgi:hypothetical protein
VFGPAKAGKTYAVLDLAMAISDPTRTHFMEWEIVQHGPVWYLQIDTPRSLFIGDYVEQAISSGRCINGVSIADQEIVPYPFNILGDGKPWLKDALQSADERPVAVVIDTLRDAHGADENDSGVMRNVVTSFVDALRPPLSAPDHVKAPALILISHQKKLQADQQLDLMSANRGSNYIAGRMDTVMRVAKGEIRAEGRVLQETILHDYKRDAWGFWVKFDPPVEIRKLLDDPQFPSHHARHKAFSQLWKVSESTARNWFLNVLNGKPYNGKTQTEDETT